MKIDIPKRENPNLKGYNDDDLRIVYKFTGDLHNELEGLIKAVVIFGSTARKQKHNDIDVLVVVDDVSMNITRELSEAYRVVVQKIIERTSVRLHIITLRFTAFWEYVKAADPVAVNILRDGVAVLDSGFFEPLQILLRKGRIKPTQESVWNYFARAPGTLQNSKWHIMQGALDLYWAVIDAAHAALMHTGEVPPTPEHVADLLHEKLVKHKLLEQKYITIMRNFYKLSKMITHREIREIRGDEFDRYFIEASDFVARMRKIIEGKK